MARKKKFKGFDWTELSERWGIDQSLEDDDMLRKTQDHMIACFGDAKLMVKVAADIREYLTVLAAGCGYDKPIYLGMLKIKKGRGDKDNRGADETLIKYTVELLGCMWT